MRYWVTATAFLILGANAMWIGGPWKWFAALMFAMASLSFVARATDPKDGG